MKVRAKFFVHEVTLLHSTPPGQRRVQLSAVAGDTPENKLFWTYTPSGRIDLHISNSETAALFKPGMEIYVDFLLPDIPPVGSTNETYKETET